MRAIVIEEGLGIGPRGKRKEVVSSGGRLALVVIREGYN